MSNRERNIIEFGKTLKVYTDGFYSNRNGEKVLIPEIEFSEFITKTTEPKSKGPYNTEVSVVNMDTFEAAHVLKTEGLTPLVLNMASAYRAGGGVRTGASAQEESLCRCSNLLKSLEQYADPTDVITENNRGTKKVETRYIYRNQLTGTKAIYTQGVSVFRNSKLEFLDKSFTVDVITIPCIVNHNGDVNTLTDIQRNIVKSKVEVILRTAIHYGQDSLVLGAFGCGVFKCPPKEIASIFKETLEMDKYRGHFKKVVFAILDNSLSFRNNKAGNYKIFKDVFAC